MNRSEIVLVVASVLGSAIAFAIPLLSLLWKAFNLISEIRMQIAELRNNHLILSNQAEHLDERWEGITEQTIQRFDHFSGRVKSEVNQLKIEVRELQNYLSKTTSFEIRSGGLRD